MISLSVSISNMGLIFGAPLMVVKVCIAPDANSHPKAPGPPQLNRGSSTTIVGPFLSYGENKHSYKLKQEVLVFTIFGKPFL